MTEAREPIQRRKLYQEVYERLLERIRSREILPGEHLPSERELMDHYGVGRSAVREAMLALARAGIVEVSHGERARVVLPTAESLVAQVAAGAQHLLRMDPASLGHLKEVREFLETGIARIAAQRADAAALARLDEALAAHHRLADERGRLAGDPASFVDGDREFHVAIAAMTGNPVFPAIVDAMFRWLGGHYRALVRAPGAESLTLREHDDIRDAIARRDPQAAEEAMRRHLARANALYGTLLRGEPTAPQPLRSARAPARAPGRSAAPRKARPRPRAG
ncbi:transcriptional regulator NanR [Zeimonas arvi]|uniref:Transcriptional regulator NanR n=1 Tax=Zeimonas arvi TaxID=2498847 RepID=A0A5C8P4S7_9BURK|nr:transcriptional regulator NanR [Zeimonas arvi]TXL68520.1 transcriptional regulator NanR [Zeimonas arvi]